MIQLQSYAFTIVEEVLSDGGNFSGLGGGQFQPPTVPSLGICEPTTGGQFGLEIAGGCCWTGSVSQIGGSWPSDHYSEVTLLVMDSVSTAFVGCVCRASSSAVSLYLLAVFGVLGSSGTALARLYHVDEENHFSLIGSATGLTLNIGDVIRLTVQGTTLTGTQNGSTIVSGTDSNLTSGSPGFEVYNSVTQTGTQVSLWSAGANQAAAPTFSLIGSVLTISSSTSGGSIYYTTDGSTPTHSSASILNGETIAVSPNQVIKAFESASDFADSSAAQYTVPGVVVNLSKLIPLWSSVRTAAIVAVFGAYFLSQQANQYTRVSTTLTALYTQTGQLWREYEMLITQPASVPVEVMGASSPTGPTTPNFPLNSPNSPILVATIFASLVTIENLNTTIDTITVDDAIAAAEYRQTANQTFGSALASGAHLSGFVPADAAVWACVIESARRNSFIANTNHRLRRRNRYGRIMAFDADECSWGFQSLGTNRQRHRRKIKIQPDSK